MVTKFKHEIKYDKPSEEIRIGILSDPHAGNKGLDKKMWERSIKWIGSYCHGWFGLGDWADCIMTSDRRRFNWKSLDRDLATPEEQYGYIEDTLEPISDECLALLTGNHDYNAEQYHHKDYVKDMAKNLGIKHHVSPEYITAKRDGEYEQQCAALGRIVFNRTTGNQKSKLDFFLHHGSGNAQTLGGKLNRARKLADIADADIYCVGHMHLAHSFYKSTVGLNRAMNVVEKRKYFALGGSFLKGWEEGTENYVQKGMYPPSSLGGMFITIKPEMNVFPFIKIEEIPISRSI